MIIIPAAPFPPGIVAVELFVFIAPDPPPPVFVAPLFPEIVPPAVVHTCNPPPPKILFPPNPENITLVDEPIELPPLPPLILISPPVASPPTDPDLLEVVAVALDPFEADDPPVAVMVEPEPDGTKVDEFPYKPSGLKPAPLLSYVYPPEAIPPTVYLAVLPICAAVIKDIAEAPAPPPPPQLADDASDCAPPPPAPPPTTIIWANIHFGSVVNVFDTPDVNIVFFIETAPLSPVKPINPVTPVAPIGPVDPEEPLAPDTAFDNIPDTLVGIFN